MAESTQHKLDRVRKPRVHITYDVETLGAEEKRELPFVVGVVGDFSGNPRQPLRPFKERKFIQVDRDNFNEVMARMTPGASFRVENTLSVRLRGLFAPQISANTPTSLLVGENVL